jgi:hypothetical protein
MVIVIFYKLKLKMEFCVKDADIQFNHRQLTSNL